MSPHCNWPWRFANHFYFSWHSGWWWRTTIPSLVTKSWAVRKLLSGQNPDTLKASFSFGLTPTIRSVATGNQWSIDPWHIVVEPGDVVKSVPAFFRGRGKGRLAGGRWLLIVCLDTLSVTPWRSSLICCWLKTMTSATLRDQSVIPFYCYCRATACGKIFDVSNLSVLGD